MPDMIIPLEMSLAEHIDGDQGKQHTFKVERGLTDPQWISLGCISCNEIVWFFKESEKVHA